MSGSDLLKSAVKCLESDSKDREDFHEPGSLEPSQEAL